MMRRGLTSFGVLLVAAWVGCGDPTRTTLQYGEIGIVYTDDAGKTQTDRSATYNFGSVFMGKETSQKLVIRNLGASSLTLVSLEKQSGDAIRINNLGDENPAFQLMFEENKTLISSEVVEIDVRFTPPRIDGVTEKDHSTTLLLRVQNAREGEDSATITLVGKGISDACDLPEALDFGTVAMGDTHRMSIEIRNPTQVSDSAAIGEIQSSSGDHNSFRFVEGSAQGDVTLEPESTARIEFEFSPTEVKTYLAFLRIRPSGQCPEQVVQLTGNSVESVLSWVPAQVDCEYATPGVQVTRQVTFTNAGNVEVNLADIRLQNNLEFGIVVDEGTDPSTLTVPAKGGTSTLTVWCKPSQYSLRQSKLDFNTNLRLQPDGTILLRAMGGGPDVAVQPSTLNFGKVAYFANAPVPAFQKRKLQVQNVGTLPDPPRIIYNLRLGLFDQNGEPIDDTIVQVNPLNAETSQTEFTVEVPPPEVFDRKIGLEAVAGKNTVDLTVTVTPESAGLKQAEIVITTNDIDEPQVRVVVSAEAVILPPCDYEVTPSTLAFGVIAPPDSRDLEFTLTNKGVNPGDTCLISWLDLDPTSHPFFSLVGGGIETRELQPGESLTLRASVKATGMTPSSKTDITGAVEFFASSPVAPHGIVPLTAQHANGCVVFAPDELDFGTVQAGCGSASTTVRMYNACGSSVTVNAFRILGSDAADPTCLNTPGCEFALDSSPAIPSGGLVLGDPNSNVTFQVRYRPQDAGLDLGGVEIDVTQDGQNLTYVVAMKGSGAAQGVQTDLFVQDASPKADVLVVMDNNYDMGDAQQKFQANVKSFLSYANLVGVDYQIAVTHPSDYQWGPPGFAMFREGVGHPEKILKRSTPDMERKFKLKLSTGTNGYYPAAAKATVTALAPPRINADHAGFLREDASLGVVVVTNFLDCSSVGYGPPTYACYGSTPFPTSYWLDRFWGIKGFAKKSAFTWSAMADYGDGCGYYVDDGAYAKYVAGTEGTKENICGWDWAAALTRLGTTAFGKRTQFFLTSAPDLNQSAIDVQVDGVSIPEIDPVRGNVWYFDQLSNSIRFNPLFAPQPGQTLTVTYHVPCFAP